ncbi:hypothetical protein [Microbacterium sp. BH-3-3-3]|uniref:hypothetical protein n=1 Tax=Microbacterium sp. BH-3-3-3 TaxID=1906742 RepID=UPI0015E1A927|nr:hypothetical protein [Microbacterium sp. BH-3-3-3]
MQKQALVLAQLAAGRSPANVVAPSEVLRLFHDFSLPAPAKIANVFASLVSKRWLAKGPIRGEYRVTPEGGAVVATEVSGLDFASLIAEAGRSAAPLLGSTALALVPVALAPPALVEPLRRFLDAHPFETNVFGMTRFPDVKAGTADPVGRALAVIREVCASKGLEFHLASDRAISDDLWTNVTAHMWASRYGVALFEDRVDRGVNHNLLIEVGAMVMTGRRCALLKDGSLKNLPTDFVGMIYKSVNLADEDTVRETVAQWISRDLGIGTI